MFEGISNIAYLVSLLSPWNIQRIDLFDSQNTHLRGDI